MSVSVMRWIDGGVVVRSELVVGVVVRSGERGGVILSLSSPLSLLDLVFLVVVIAVLWWCNFGGVIWWF